MNQSIKMTTSYNEVKPIGHYIYFHRKATNGKIFYVGKGQGRRAWGCVVSDRNKYWTRTALKHGVIVEIVKCFDTEVCALTFEKILIGIIGIKNLTNMTLGGEGMSGYSPSSATLEKKRQSMLGKRHSEETRRKIGNARRGSIVSAKTREKQRLSHLGKKQSAATCEKRSLSSKGKHMRENSGKFDPTIRLFSHKSHGNFIGCSYDLRHKYNIGSSCVRSIIIGRQPTAKGWSYCGIYDC